MLHVRFADQLIDKAREQSSREREALTVLIDAYADWAEQNAATERVWAEAFGIGQNTILHPGSRLELAHRAGAQTRREAGVGQRQPERVTHDGRIPGRSPWDYVKLNADPVPYGSAGVKAGTRYRPRDVLDDVVGQLRDRDCLPAAVVRSPHHGSPGLYRHVAYGHPRLLDEHALRKARDEVLGENGLSAWRWVSELSAEQRRQLQESRDMPIGSYGEAAAKEAAEPEPMSAADVSGIGSGIADDALPEVETFTRDGREFIRFPDGVEMPAANVQGLR